MTDAATPGTSTALPDALGHDGLASRAFLTAIGVFVSVIVLSSTFLALGKLTGDQWVQLAEWLAASTVGGYGVANVGQRVAAALAVRGQ